MTDHAVCKYAFNTVTASGSDANLPTCTISTISADREGDRVIPEGGKFENFLKSPVLMWAHGGADHYSAVPIGSVVSLDVQPGQGIKASWKWLEGDAFADRIKNAWDQGVIRASSIGFKPIQATPNGQGLDHESWELIELSLCAVPMNPEAVRTLKSLGLMDDPGTIYGPDGKALPPAEGAPDPPVDVTLDASLVDKVVAQKIVSLENALAEAVEKRGRVLSAVNESRLRAALDAVNDVLAQLVSEATDPEPEPEPEATLEPIAFALDDEPVVLRLLLDESEDEPTITLVDDRGNEPVFVIDPDLMRKTITDTLREQLQASVVDPIGARLEAAIDLARGRVH